MRYPKIAWVVQRRQNGVCDPVHKLPNKVAKMQIAVHRLDRTRYRSVLDRDDGVRYLLDGAGAKGRRPHDLVHYVVESQLGLESGFWGSIADGAVFPGMTWLYGRRRPHATDRGEAVMRANDD